jgi:hypothetical protein
MVHYSMLGCDPLPAEARLLSFTPSPKLEKALKAVQATIHRLAADLAHLPDAEAAWLQRWALISTIGASTRIENAVLTDAEIDWVDTAISQEACSAERNRKVA